MSVQRRGGRVPGAEGYHRDDTHALLASVERVMPMKAEDWDKVLLDYRETHALPNDRARRDANSLKCKFKQLAKGDKPESSKARDLMEAIDARMADGKWMQRRGGRARGAEGFSVQDSQAILSCVRRFLPIYRDEWDRTADEYFSTYASLNDRVRRDGVSLKNKFRQWSKSNYEPDISPPEVKEAKDIQREISARITRLAKEAEATKAASAGGDATRENQAAGENGEGSAIETEEPGAPEVKLRRGGRPPGSEGYTRSDTKALLACIKQVLPTGPSSWTQVLQLYRMTHATPNKRSARAVSGVKSKFRQLVNYKEALGQEVPPEVREARAIQMDIDLSTKLGKTSGGYNSASDSQVSTAAVASATTAPDSLATPTSSEEYEDKQPGPRSELQPTGHGNHKNMAAAEVSLSEASDNGALGKRQRAQDGQVDAADIKTPMDVVNEALRSEIASRELELLRQREQREAELAAWEKERVKREKQRLDMAAWTSVCDRLRTLYREQAAEQNPEIAGDIDEEIRLLKKKKQRLAELL